MTQPADQAKRRHVDLVCCRHVMSSTAGAGLRVGESARAKRTAALISRRVLKEHAGRAALVAPPPCVASYSHHRPPNMHNAKCSHVPPTSDSKTTRQAKFRAYGHARTRHCHRAVPTTLIDHYHKGLSRQGSFLSSYVPLPITWAFYPTSCSLGVLRGMMDNSNLVASSPELSFQRDLDVLASTHVSVSDSFHRSSVVSSHTRNPGPLT